MSKCKHCDKDGLCDKSELKIDKKLYEVWYECSECGSGKHFKYTTNLMGNTRQHAEEEAYKKRKYCKFCTHIGRKIVITF